MSRSAKKQKIEIRIVSRSKSLPAPAARRIYMFSRDGTCEDCRGFKRGHSGEANYKSSKTEYGALKTPPEWLLTGASDIARSIKESFELKRTLRI